MHSQVPNLFRRFQNTKIDSQFLWSSSWGRAWFWLLVSRTVDLGSSFNLRRHRLSNLRGLGEADALSCGTAVVASEGPGWPVWSGLAGEERWTSLFSKILWFATLFFVTCRGMNCLGTLLGTPAVIGICPRIWRRVEGLPRNWHWWSPWHWAKQMRWWRHHPSSRLGKLEA